MLMVMMMTRLVARAAFLVCVTLALTVAAGNSLTTLQPRSGLCPRDLPHALDQLFAKRLGSADLGAKVVFGNDSRVIYQSGADRLRTPASNTKLLTNAAILLDVGPRYQVKTAVYEADDGNLCVIGSGDPALNTTHVAKLAKSVHAAGLKHMDGITFDSASFTPALPVDSWETGDMTYGYGAQPNALSMTENVGHVWLGPGRTVGSPCVAVWRNESSFAPSPRVRGDPYCVTVAATANATAPDVLYRPGVAGYYATGAIRVNDTKGVVARVAVLVPEERFANEFLGAAAREKVKIDSWSTDECEICRTAPAMCRTLGVVESPALAELVSHCLHVSDNLYASTFLHWLGALAHSKGHDTSHTTRASGLRAVQDHLKALNVSVAGRLHQVDGSGLSAHNWVAPSLFVDLLQAMRRTPFFESVWLPSLPTAGVSGTLKYRFHGTPAAGKVHAKTGTIAGTSALSGYIDAMPHGVGNITFSFIINHSLMSTHQREQLIDDAVVMLAKLVPCEH